MEIEVFIQENLRRNVEGIRQSTENEAAFWRSTFEFLREFTDDGLRYIDQEFVVKFLLATLQLYGSSDFTTITLILRRYTMFCEGNVIEAPEYLSRSMRALYMQTRYLLTYGFTDKIIYYEDDLIHLDSMNSAIDTADYNFTICLVKYGLYSRKKIAKLELKRIASLFLEVWGYMKRNILDERVNRESSFLIIKDFLEYITERDLHKFPDVRPKRRISFVLKVLKALIMMKENDPSTETYVECQRLFFRIIPEPYVSQEEVDSFLRFLFKDAVCTDTATAMFLDIYAKVFDFESSMPYAPRTLKHLSRCAVRNSIIKNSNTISKSIDSLCLPETLKHLLLGAPE